MASTFWSKQPVAAAGTLPQQGPIVALPEDDPALRDPLSLPEGLSFCRLDPEDERGIEEILSLVNGHAADDGGICLSYPAQTLRWLLTVPGTPPEWRVGVRDGSGSLIGCVFATPTRIRLYGALLPLALVDFLCVERRSRGRGLAPLLIRELTRQIQRSGCCQQALHFGSEPHPPAVASSRLYHRVLDEAPLRAAAFFEDEGQAPADPLPSALMSDLRPMCPEDIDEALLLLERWSMGFDLAPAPTRQEALHLLLPPAPAGQTWVRRGPAGLTDLIAFTLLPNTSDTGTGFLAARLVCIVGQSEPRALWSSALALAARAGAAVLDALDHGGHAPVLGPLGFIEGTGVVYTRLYNWSCPPVRLDRSVTAPR